MSVLHSVQIVALSHTKIIVIRGGYPLGMTGKNDDRHLEKTNFINLFSETPAATLRLLRRSATTLKKRSYQVLFVRFGSTTADPT